MVARIVSGKSIRGILNYNENKLREAEAKVLLAAGFPREPGQLSFKDKLERFEKLTALNERTRTNALHITLNFSRQDKVDDDLLRLLAMEYMQAIGFGGQPFLVYRHFDAAHPHIHLATVNIDANGDRIETHNIGKHQSEKARKELEIKYGLIRAEDQKKEMEYLLRPVNLEKLAYGKRETKAGISSIVREVTGSYKFGSLPELNAVLRQFNVLAYRGEPGSAMYEKEGLTYHLLDERGHKVGVPIKASSIYGAPTLKNLEKKFKPNEVERKPYTLRLRHLLDKAIAGSVSAEELKRKLQQQGVRILFRENADGNIYGVTYIDNATRSVINGSDLGKTYSAKGLLDRLRFSKDELFSEGSGSANRQEPSGKKVEANGKIVEVDKRTPFYVYIICDIRPSLLKILERREFDRTPDGKGWFKVKSKFYSAYFEVMPFEKVLDDARKRNRILFEKLKI